jgi:hypothetical protein
LIAVNSRLKVQLPRPYGSVTEVSGAVECQQKQESVRLQRKLRGTRYPMREKFEFCFWAIP